MARYFRNPLTEHMVTHNHDLRSGPSGQPSGGETAAEHEANKPKRPFEEAMRPSHVYGGEKNAPAPEPPAGTKGVGLDLGEGGRVQEGLRRSGTGSAGVGGLEGVGESGERKG